MSQEDSSPIKKLRLDLYDTQTEPFSPTLHSPDSGHNHKLDIANKKIKVLKAALVEEHTMRAELEDEIDGLQSQCKSLEENLAEKENELIRVSKENEHLQDEILFKNREIGNRRTTLKQPMGNPSPPVLIKNELMLQLEYENKEHKSKNAELESLMLELQKHVSASEGTIYEIEKNYSKHLKKLEDSILQLKEESQKKDVEVMYLKVEVLDQKQANCEMAAAKEQMQAQMDEKEKQTLKIKNEMFKYKEQTDISKQAIFELTKTLKKHEKESYELTDKLVIMKNELIENYACTDIFLVTKIGSLMNVPAKMTFYKDKDYPHDYYLKIEDYEKSRKIRILDIESMRSNDKTQNRFYLQYREGNRKPMSEQYESTQRDKVLTYFKDFRLHAISNCETGRVSGDPTNRTYSFMH